MGQISNNVPLEGLVVIVKLYSMSLLVCELLHKILLLHVFAVEYDLFKLQMLLIALCNKKNNLSS